MRPKLIRILAACAGSACLIALSSCACECPTLSIDQSDAVGAFVSLSKDPLDSTVPPEVGPARIRAVNGENIIWVLRNPSPQDVRVKLDLVTTPGSSVDIKSVVFSDLGGTVTVAKDCGLGSLQAQLQSAVVVPDSAHPCLSKRFNYSFRLYVETDSIIVEFPYDPELVVEGEP